MTNRPPVVAYFNSRLILMLQHEDCVEYKTRAEFCGYVWEHTALVYEEAGVWFILQMSYVPNTGIQVRFDADACLNEKEARKAAVRRVGTAQGRVVMG